MARWPQVRPRLSRVTEAAPHMRGFWSTERIIVIHIAFQPDNGDMWVLNHNEGGPGPGIVRFINTGSLGNGSSSQ